MQPIRTSRSLLAEIDRVLAAKPAQWRNSPLDEVAGTLSRGRRYEGIAIYLAVEERSNEPPRPAAGLAVPIRMGQRLLGAIEVRGARTRHEDERLLKAVATRLARFLTGNGKWLVRKLRERKRQAESAAGRAAGR